MSETQAVGPDTTAESFPGLDISQLTCSIKNTDMLPRFSSAAISLAQEALQQSSDPAALAAALKQGFDGRFGPAWHCIAGSNFGSQVVHEARSFIFFTVAGLSVLLFKSGTE